MQALDCPNFGGVVEWLSRSVTSDMMGVITPTIAAIRINQPLSGQQTSFQVGWFAMRDAGSNPATVTFCRRSPIGRDNGLKIRPVWVRVPSAVFVPVA